MSNLPCGYTEPESLDDFLARQESAITELQATITEQAARIAEFERLTVPNRYRLMEADLAEKDERIKEQTRALAKYDSELAEKSRRMAILKDANQKLGAHAREKEKDAARYDFLRRFDHFACVDAMLDTTEYNTLDSAVDSAIPKFAVLDAASGEET